MELNEQTVLLIEDDRISARELTRQLHTIDMHVVGARSGAEALAVLKGPKPPEQPVLLVEWRLPGMGGDGVLNAIAWFNQPPPVVALTWTHSERDDALALGATVALVRPVQNSDLRKAISLAPSLRQRHVHPSH